MGLFSAFTMSCCCCDDVREVAIEGPRHPGQETDVKAGWSVSSPGWDWR